MTAACSLTIISSLFIGCSTPSYGGAVHAQRGCISSEVSYSTFLGCNAWVGGGLMTYRGPTSFVPSSRFFLCSVKHAGGAFYHNGESSYSITLSDSLFTRNTADAFNHDPIDYGGGALKDYREGSYTSMYSFSFFSDNTAQTNFGHDIAISSSRLSTGNIIHCFTTTTENSFCNAGSYQDNWLPLTNINEAVAESAHKHDTSSTSMIANDSDYSEDV